MGPDFSGEYVLHVRCADVIKNGYFQGFINVYLRWATV